MTVHPLGDHVLLERIETKTTRAGIVIPDTAKETSQKAKVVAVGMGRLNEHGVRIPPELKKGDVVLVRRYAGTELEVDGKEYVVVTENDILGALR